MKLFSRGGRVPTAEENARAEEDTARGMRRSGARSRAAGHDGVADEIERIAAMYDENARRIRGRPSGPHRPR